MTDLRGPKIHIYVRCSTEEQATGGTSPEAQRGTIQATTTFVNLDISGAEWYEDIGVSGFSKGAKDRPASCRMLRDLLDGDTIVASAIDRLFRNAADAIHHFHEWEKRNVRIIICNMGGLPADNASAVGKLLLSMTAVFAEFESQRIGERTRAGLEVLKKKHGGIIPGRIRYAPLGYRFANPTARYDDRLRLIPVPAMLRMVREVRKLYRDGVEPQKILEMYDKTDAAIRYYRVRDKQTQQWVQKVMAFRWSLSFIDTAVCGESWAHMLRGYKERGLEHGQKGQKNRERRRRLSYGFVSKIPKEPYRAEVS